MNNPFTLSFGKKPAQFISRISQTNLIADNFTAENPPSQVYIITGVRGSGKTVMLTTITDILKNKGNWITVEINPERDMLSSLCGKLYSIPELHRLFISAKLNFSAFGLGVSFENSVPVSDIETVLTQMLTHIKKAGKRLLITVDEATGSKNMRIFASSFQILMRQDLPVYLLLTGLYQNVQELQNSKTITFLYRAPKITLEPLSKTAIIRNYMEVFNITHEQALEMANLTKGYPFAFQVLGYLQWEHKNKPLSGILPEYDQYLEEYVYSKIWEELSDLDRKVLQTLTLQETQTVAYVREKLNMPPEKFSVYRDRLSKKGLINTDKRGYVSLALPRFDLFIKNRF